MSRYSNIEYLMKMDAEHGLKLIWKAIESEQKENLYKKWLHDPSRFKVNFEDYIKSHTPYRKSTQSEREEILKKWG